MKKLLKIALSGLMLLSMTACGGGESGATDSGGDLIVYSPNSDALIEVLETFGENVFGRNGQTKELTHVCMSISDPTQRWVERRKPAISPAFAIAELVMIMNGSDEAALLNAWNPALPKYQGKYDRYPGSYGKRLRYSFGFDQINRAYDVLKNNPESRQGSDGNLEARYRSTTECGNTK